MILALTIIQYRAILKSVQAKMEKAADAADMSVLFSQLVLIFKPRARKTMREECFTHCIISSSAISININPVSYRARASAEERVMGECIVWSIE